MSLYLHNLIDVLGLGHFRVPQGPLFQKEIECTTFDMEIIFQSHAKSDFHKKELCTWPHFESEGFWNSKVA